MKQGQWENWLNLVLGVWFFILPWSASSTALSTAASWNMWLCGAGVAISAVLALRELQQWEEWVNITLGAWMTFSPWTFGYQSETTLLWNSIIVGLSVTVLSIAALQVARKAKA